MYMITGDPFMRLRVYVLRVYALRVLVPEHVQHAYASTMMR